jgi:hypothetical protein
VVRTLEAVFDKSGVIGVPAHRFRHTLATEVLVHGGSLEGAAKVLGDSPEIKHYAKWSAACQHRTVELFSKIDGIPVDSGTLLAHEKNAPPNLVESSKYLVLEVGVEPT